MLYSFEDLLDNLHDSQFPEFSPLFAPGYCIITAQSPPLFTSQELILPFVCDRIFCLIAIVGFLVNVTVLPPS
jgi:hypothetical protein